AAQFWRSRMTRAQSHLPTVCCGSRTAALSAKNGRQMASTPFMLWRSTAHGRPMLKGDSTFTMLIVAAILALGVGYYVPKAFVARPAEPGKSEATPSSLVTGAAKAAPAKPEWAASAPGRVEP